jgi:hypothetical protein
MGQDLKGTVVQIAQDLLQEITRRLSSKAPELGGTA